MVAISHLSLQPNQEGQGQRGILLVRGNVFCPSKKGDSKEQSKRVGEGKGKRGHLSSISVSQE